MPLYSDENRLRELERKVNRLLQDNRELKQQVTQANQTARAIANPQAQGQPGTSGPVCGAATTGTIGAGSGSGGAGTGTANIYFLTGATNVAGPTGVTIYNTFTGSIPTSTWVLVIKDSTGNYQVIAEQC